MRKTSDTHYPSITIHTEEGSSTGDESYSLFPGGRVKKYKVGDYTSAATIDVKLDPARGKTRSRHLTLAEVGPC